MAGDKGGVLPKHLEELRSRVVVGRKTPTNTEGIYYSGAFASVGFDNSLSVEELKKRLKVRVLERNGDDHIVFEVVGIDAPIANTIRRILLAEVPTMAVKSISIRNNSSVIHDEILAHRIGLIPLNVDPRLFGMPEDDEHLTEDTSIHYKLKVACTRNPNAPVEAAPSEKYVNSDVFSSMFKWVPIGNQAEKFKDWPPEPVHDDILIAKLRPGQEIDLDAVAVKGISRDHAKFSPVATAFYKMLPVVELQKPVRGAEAKELKNKCPMDVFDIEDSGEAVVARPRQCTMCRECIREGDWEEKVKLSRKRDHFIFSIESTGAMRPEDLFIQALQVLVDKCAHVTTKLKEALELSVSLKEAQSNQDHIAHMARMSKSG